MRCRRCLRVCRWCELLRREQSASRAGSAATTPTATAAAWRPLQFADLLYSARFRRASDRVDEGVAAGAFAQSPLPGKGLITD